MPIKKALDLGAHGIIVPQVNTPEQAANVVRWARYAPEGARGVGLARAHGYGVTFREYLGAANREIAVIVQAEHVRAVDNIEAIVRVPGAIQCCSAPTTCRRASAKRARSTIPSRRGDLSS